MYRGRIRLAAAAGFLAILAAGCVTNGRYALDGDFNGQDPPEELSPEEEALKEDVFGRADVVETFSDSRLERGFSLEQNGRIVPEMGYLESTSPGRDAEHCGRSLRFRSPEGRPIQSITVGWDLTSSTGHLICWAPIEGFGKPTFFLNQGGISAHTHLDSLGGDTEYLGWEDHLNRGYVLQEIRIEGDEFILLYNGEEFARYSMDEERLIDSITLGNNDGGEGRIDFAAVEYAERGEEENWYALDGDLNGREPPKELSPEEEELKQSILARADVVETFNDDTLEPGCKLVPYGRIIPEEGVLESFSPGRDDGGRSLWYRDPRGRKIKSVAIGWNLTSSQGNLHGDLYFDKFGEPGISLHDDGVSSSIFRTSDQGESEDIDYKEISSRGYVIQEIRREGDEILFLYNGDGYSRTPLDTVNMAETMAIASHGGGSGKIDFIALDLTDREPVSLDWAAPEGRGTYRFAYPVIHGPRWYDQNRLAGVIYPDNKIVITNRQGEIQEEYGDINIDGVEWINPPEFSPDRSSAVMMAGTGRDSDLFLFRRDQEKLLRLTDNGMSQGPSFEDENTLVYCEYDESQRPEVQQRLYRYHLESGKKDLLYENRFVEEEEGLVSWDPQVNKDNGEILLKMHDFSKQHGSFLIISPEGDILQNLQDTITFDSVFSAIWYDNETILVSATQDEQPGCYLISLPKGTVEQVNPDFPDDAESLYSISLSPDKKWVAGICWEEQPGWDESMLFVFPLPERR